MAALYSPELVDVIVAGQRLEEFGADTFISISSEAGQFTDNATVDGRVVRNRILDKRATITITLMQTSPSNEILNGLMRADESGPGATFAFRMADRSGATVAEAADAWIQNDPDIERGQEAGEVTWELRCAILSRTHGGTGPAFR